jgi:hypothetical protein
LDSALTSPSLVFIQDSDKESSLNLILRQSDTLLECLRSCWKEDVLVFSAADKFLRLTLQLLSRYSFWVSSALNNRKSNASPSPGCEWAVSATAEDFVYVSYLFLRSSYFGHFGISAISCLLNQLQLCSVG